jgi:hypothetical protein
MAKVIYAAIVLELLNERRFGNGTVHLRYCTQG